MSQSGDQARSVSFVLLSTILHASAILVITLSKQFAPKSTGGNQGSAQSLDFDVQSSEIKAQAQSVDAIVTEPAQVAKTPKAAEVIEPKAASPAPVAIKPPRPIKAKPIANVLPVKTQVSEELLAEESPVEVLNTGEKEESSDEAALAAIAAKEAVSLEQAKVAEAEKLKNKQAEREQRLEEIENDKRLSAEKIAKEEADRLAANKKAEEEALAKKAEADAAAALAQAAAAGTGQGNGAGDLAGNSKGQEKITVDQDYLQLRQAPGNRPPEYSRDMRLKKLQGRGQLVYDVTKEGTVTNIRLTQSTGSPELDQAALDAFKKYKFVPGQEGTTVHNFEFNLKGPAEPDRGRLRTSLKD